MRAYERLLIAYFCYCAVVAQILPLRAPIPALVPLLNLTVIAALALLAWAHGLRRREMLGVIRDWFPFPLLLLTYREMGWFAQPILAHTLEQRWVEWDRMALRGGLSAIIEALGPVMPSMLEISYTLVYGLGPFAVAMLYAYGRRDRVPEFFFPMVLAVLLCYVQFPFWPSEPPRTVFPGEDFPAWNTVFRRFNWWMLGGQGMHTSVFPSAHVAGAFGAAFGMRLAMPEPKWVGRSLLAMAVLISTATVYGRYHYLADAAAGLAMALIALAVSQWRRRRAEVG